MLGALTLILTLAGAAQDSSALPGFSRPVRVADLDMSRLKGEPYRLAWSPDGGRLYLQTVERDKRGLVQAAHHYTMEVAGGAPPRKIDAEPDWATAYWTWKSGQSAPARPAFRITVEDRQQRLTSTATPMGGDLARGAPDGTGGDSGTLSAAMQSQMAHLYTLTLKGEVIGEFVNTVAVPGLTFGWAPEGVGLIAFANKDGRLVIMNEQGRKQQIADAKSALLPAWTDDGKRLAFLDRTGKSTAVLKVVDVTPETP